MSSRDRGEGRGRDFRQLSFIRRSPKNEYYFFRIKILVLQYEIDAHLCKVEKIFGVRGVKKIQSLEGGNILIVRFKDV